MAANAVVNETHVTLDDKDNRRGVLADARANVLANVRAFARAL
jgi:hypothetical protein